MSKSTHLDIRVFPDEAAARAYLEHRRWPDGPRCPVCGMGERITPRKDASYRCNRCKEDFTVRTGTILERSHVPLHKWLYAMYMLVTECKSVSSLQLSKQIGITQKSAWFLLHRLREASPVNAKPPRGLDAITNKVMAYRPKPRSEPAKRRKRRAAKIKRAKGDHGLHPHNATARLTDEGKAVAFRHG